MSIIDLFLIGFLVERPWNAYELAKFIEGHNLQQIARISTPAIYKNLVKLAQRDYLDVEVIRDGDMPEKKVYSITEKGRAYFHELLRKAADAPLYYHFTLNTVVMHLNKLDKAEGLKFLQQLKEVIYQKKTFIDKEIQEHDEHTPLVGRSIIRQQQLVNTAMIQWIEELIEQYKEEKSDENRRNHQ